MKNLFVVNPAAGKAMDPEPLVQKIRQAGNEMDLPVEIHITDEPGGSEHVVRKYLASAPVRESVRIFAAGGDGTLNEVINGAYPFFSTHQIHIGCIPTGTGNDFIRNFPGRDFLDMERQLSAESRQVDLIQYQYKTALGETSRYCVNMFNIGFDCDVVYRTGQIKNGHFLHGSMAYLAGILVTLIKKEGADLTIQFDDGSVHSGKILLMSTGNGCYCGGGIKGIPKALVDDGKMDISIVEDATRRQFMQLFPKYAKGIHLEDPRAQEILTYRQCKWAIVTPNRGSMRLCTDGEIQETGTIELMVQPKALSFLVPKTESGQA